MEVTLIKNIKLELFPLKRILFYIKETIDMIVMVVVIVEMEDVETIVMDATRMAEAEDHHLMQRKSVRLQETMS